MTATYKRWMLFIDGENLTIRAQKLAERQGVALDDAKQFPVYRKNVYFWPAGCIPYHHQWTDRGYVAADAERCYYYTCTQGDELKRGKVHDALMQHGFSPVVFHKPKPDKKAKGVDIALTKDMLMHAFFGNYEIAVLVSGDGDYVPVVEEIKRLGKRVVVAFFTDEGLNPELRRAADELYSLPLCFKAAP
jgi:uncharacterized LabA/DUF88 family protein